LYPSDVLETYSHLSRTSVNGCQKGKSYIVHNKKKWTIRVMTLDSQVPKTTKYPQNPRVSIFRKVLRDEMRTWVDNLNVSPTSASAGRLRAPFRVHHVFQKKYWRTPSWPISTTFIEKYNTQSPSPFCVGLLRYIEQLHTSAKSLHVSWYDSRKMQLSLIPHYLRVRSSRMTTSHQAYYGRRNIDRHFTPSSIGAALAYEVVCHGVPSNFKAQRSGHTST
jgi:hypothetical protein